MLALTLNQLILLMNLRRALIRFKRIGLILFLKTGTQNNVTNGKTDLKMPSKMFSKEVKSLILGQKVWTIDLNGGS